jgi:hypothetical protein
LVSAKSQYRYFLSLDKTVRLAASFYLVILLGGTAVILLGIEQLARDIHTRDLFTPLMLAGCMVLAFAGFLYWLGKVTWISKVHGWLDGFFFRLMEKSDMILFQGLILALHPEERSQADNLQPVRKESLANAVFSGLAQSNTLFAHLLRTGIFRFWIWYWIAMYGTFVFAILTAESFALVLRGVDLYGKTAFGVAWGLAIAHLVLGAVLGRKLVRMTEGVAQLLVRLQGDEIASMMTAELGNQEEIEE